MGSNRASYQKQYRLTHPEYAEGLRRANRAYASAARRLSKHYPGVFRRLLDEERVREGLPPIGVLKRGRPRRG